MINSFSEATAPPSALTISPVVKAAGFFVLLSVAVVGRRPTFVSYIMFGRIEDAIAREKQLKKWNRAWKDKLITGFNPEWFIGL